VDIDNSQLPTADFQGEYCKQIEDYLVRKNGGHLVRIVGPAFEQVCGWAARGVPLKVVYRGIDRYLERHNAKREFRRRPVRVEFCEADVLDVFDQWKRAIGLGGVHLQAEGPDGDAPHMHHRESLPAHLERLIARLTALRGGQDRSLDATLDIIVRELDGVRGKARGLRGEPREQVLARLRELDTMLLAAARERCDAATLQQLGEDADLELAPFRERMPRDAYQQSRAACVDRLLRERSRLPTLTLE
jgi:hypothetical protein